MTIEHFAPQSDKTSSRYAELGNLVWVPEQLNGKLGNKSILDKQEILKKQTGLWIPAELRDAKTWDDAAITARTTAISEVGYEDIWGVGLALEREDDQAESAT